MKSHLLPKKSSRKSSTTSKSIPAKKSSVPTSNSSSSYTFDPVALKKSLTRDARALGIPSGSAEAFIDRTLKSVTKSLKPTPTESEVNRAVIREMKKYSPDFTYYLQHKNEII